MDILAQALALILIAEGYQGKPGDGGRAVGEYQIHKIYVDDVNRILGEEVYSYADREDPKKSREMVVIYLSHYGTAKRLGRIPTVEDLCRIHNAGPNGWKESCSIAYWKRIMELTGRIA